MWQFIMFRTSGPIIQCSPKASSRQRRGCWRGSGRFVLGAVCLIKRPDWLLSGETRRTMQINTELWTVFDSFYPKAWIDNKDAHTHTGTRHRQIVNATMCRSMAINPWSLPLCHAVSPSCCEMCFEAFGVNVCVKFSFFDPRTWAAF